VSACVLDTSVYTPSTLTYSQSIIDTPHLLLTDAARLAGRLPRRRCAALCKVVTEQQQQQQQRDSDADSAAAPARCAARMSYTLQFAELTCRAPATRMTSLHKVPAARLFISL